MILKHFVPKVKTSIPITMNISPQTSNLYFTILGVGSNATKGVCRKGDKIIKNIMNFLYKKHVNRKSGCYPANLCKLCENS